MEIIAQQVGESLEIRVRGRLDNYWTEHLRSNLEEAIRRGAHGIRLNLADVTFLSSAGVGLLVTFHNQLKGIGGSFIVTSPSERVKQVLDLCRLSPILIPEKIPVAAPVHAEEIRRFSHANVSFEVVDTRSAKPLQCRMIGDPSLLPGCRFRAGDCHTVRFPQASFGIGLGAFGEDFADAQTRFGEFLAVGGSAAYLPTDGTNVADFVISSGELVPELKVLYGLRCQGEFGCLMRFETSAAESPISLSELARTALEVSGAPVIGMTMVAESAGLLGAALRRSPAGVTLGTDAPFRYPEVRSWLSFSTERLFARSLALVAGVAASKDETPLAALLRPLENQSVPLGHFHAAAFSYRPLKKGRLDLDATVTSLFETETLQGVLHLLTDHRETAGAQQSEFVRGACWIGALSEIRQD
jgi:anti-anti-sigma factor